MAISKGPTVKPLDLIPSFSYYPDRISPFRKHKKYLWHPMYDEKSDILIGYIPYLADFINHFISNYPSIYKPYTDLYGGYPSGSHKHVHGFDSTGKLYAAGECYIGKCTFDGASSAWVTKVGSSIGTIAFDESEWIKDGIPSIPNFTATVTSVVGAAIAVTIDSTVYNTTLSGSFTYGTYFTIPISASAIVGNSATVTINPIASAFPGGGKKIPAYNALKNDLTKFAPTYVSGPTSFVCRPGHNIIKVSDIGPVFKNSLNVNRNFPCTYFYAYTSGAVFLGEFDAIKSHVTHYTGLLQGAFGNEDTYPVVSYSKYGERDWLTYSFDEKKFKDLLQSQYAKKYIDMSFDDAKKYSSFGDTQTMSIQFPRYDATGKLLNNPIFDATGKQIGGVSLVKNQPLYDAALISQREFLSIVVDDEIKQLDVSLSIIKGEAVYSNNGQKLAIEPDHLLYNPRTTSIWANDSNSVFRTEAFLGIKDGYVHSLSGSTATGLPRAVLSNNKKFVMSYLGAVSYKYADPSVFNKISDIVDYLDTCITVVGWDLTYDEVGSIVYCILKPDGLYFPLPSNLVIDKQFGHPKVTISASSSFPHIFSYSYSTSGTPYETEWKVIGDISYSKIELTDGETVAKNIFLSQQLTSPAYFVAVITEGHLLVYITSQVNQTENFLDAFGVPKKIGVSSPTATHNFSIKIPDTLAGFNTIRTAKLRTTADQYSGKLMGFPSVAVYDDKLRLFNLSYNFKSVTIDRNCYIRIVPIMSNLFSGNLLNQASEESRSFNKYFVNPYKILDARKLLAAESALDSNNIFSLGIKKGFDIDSHTNSVIYRTRIEEEAEDGTVFDIINYQQQTKKTYNIDSAISIVYDHIVLLGNYIYFSPTWSSGILTDAQPWTVGNSLTNILTTSWDIDNGKFYAYILRGSAFLQSGGEYVNFQITAVSTQYLKCNPQGAYDVSILQAGDKIAIFKKQQVLPEETNAVKLPSYTRSITEDDTYFYILYRPAIGLNQARVKIVTKSKFINGDTDYLYADIDISSHASATAWALFNSFVYDEANDCLWLGFDSNATGHYTLLKLDKSTLAILATIVNQDLAGLLKFLPIFTDDSGYVYFMKKKYDASTGSDSGVYNDYLVSESESYLVAGAGVPGLTISYLLGYSGIDYDETTAEYEEIAVSGGIARDVVDNPPLYTEESTDYFHFYFTTKNPSSALYNYYRVRWALPQQSVFNRKPHIEFVKALLSDGSLGNWPDSLNDYPYSNSVVSNVVTLNSQYNGSAGYISPYIVCDLSFVVDPISKVSAIYNGETTKDYMTDFDTTGKYVYAPSYYGSVVGPLGHKMVYVSTANLEINNAVTKVYGQTLYSSSAHSFAYGSSPLVWYNLAPTSFNSAALVVDWAQTLSTVDTVNKTITIVLHKAVTTYVPVSYHPYWTISGVVDSYINYATIPLEESDMGNNALLYLVDSYLNSVMPAGYWYGGI
jgi:hypothetical protein